MKTVKNPPNKGVRSRTAREAEVRDREAEKVAAYLRKIASITVGITVGGATKEGELRIYVGAPGGTRYAVFVLEGFQ
jgi:hypothetical protein